VAKLTTKGKKKSNGGGGGGGYNKVAAWQLQPA